MSQLLDDLVGHTTDDHPDFPNLLEAQETIAVVARDTNESFRLVELSRKILEIQVGCGSESRQELGRGAPLGVSTLNRNPSRPRIFSDCFPWRASPITYTHSHALTRTHVLLCRRR